MGKGKTSKTKLRTDNPHNVDIDVTDDFDFVDEDEVIIDQKFGVMSFYEPKYDTLELRELLFFNEFLKECLREDPELDKKRINFKKVSETKLRKLYNDFRFDNYEDLMKKAKKTYPDQVFERAVKLRGNYKSHNKALDRRNFLKKRDQVHSQFIGEVGKWLPFNPPEHAIEDYETSNKKLNEMMHAQRANAQEAKEFYEQERQERIKQSVELNEKRKKAIKNDDEDAILAEQLNQEILGLTDGPVKRPKRPTKPKPSKAGEISKNVDPSEAGVVGQVDTKNYKGIKLRKKDFQDKVESIEDLRNLDGEETQEFKESFGGNMAGDVKELSRRKKNPDDLRMTMDDFDDADFDETLANDIIKKTLRKQQ